MEPIKNVTEEQRDRLATYINYALAEERLNASLSPVSLDNEPGFKRDFKLRDQHGILTEVALAYKDQRLGDITDEVLAQKQAQALRLSERAGLEGTKLIDKAKDLVDIAIAKAIPGQSVSTGRSAVR